MKVARVSAFAVPGPAHEASPPRPRAAAALAIAIAALALPRAAAGQASRFADVPLPTGILVNDQGEVVVVSGEPATLIRFTADGARAAETPLEADRARSRLAWGTAMGFHGAVLLSPGGALEITPLGENAPEGAVFQLAEQPLTIEAPDLDAASAPATLQLQAARFDDVAVGPAVVPPGGGPAPLDLFVTGLTAMDDLGNGGRPFLIRVRVDLVAKQAQLAGLATTQGPVIVPPFPSGVGLRHERGPDGAPTNVSVVTSFPSKTFAQGTDAGNVLVTVGAGFPEDTRPEAAPTWFQDHRGETKIYAASGMGTDSAGNLYMVVAIGACAGSQGPGVVVYSPGDVKCAVLPETTASGGSDVGVGTAGEPLYVTDEPGNAVLRLDAPPNVTPPPAAGPAAAARAGSWR